MKNRIRPINAVRNVYKIMAGFRVSANRIFGARFIAGKTIVDTLG